MKTPHAILIAAVLIGACILIRPAEAQRMPTGQFQLMHHSNTVANAGVFRIDTATGEVSYCFIGADGALSCQKER